METQLVSTYSFLDPSCAPGKPLLQASEFSLQS